MNIIRIKKSAWAVSIYIAGLMLLIGLSFFIIKRNRALNYIYSESKEIELSKKVYRARQSVHEAFNAITNEIQNQTNTFSLNEITNFPSYLTDILKSLPYASAIGIAFAPYQYNKKDQLHAIYIAREQNSFKEIDILKYYNYLSSSWYQTGMGESLTWMEPFFEVSINTEVLRLVTPIFTFDTASNTRVPIGVFFIDVSRRELNTLVNKTIYDPNTYAFIVSSNDTLISYPIESYLTDYKTLFNVSQLPGKKDWNRVGNIIEKKHGGVTVYYDSLSNESYWVSFEPLHIANWLFVYVAPQESLFNITSIRHNIIQIAGIIYLFFFYITIFILFLRKSSHKKFIVSFICSMGFIILTILQLYITSKISQKLDQTIVKSKVDLARFQDFQEQRDKQLRKPQAIYIPTGIIIQNLLQQSADKLEIQGILWQKYGADTKDIKKEIGLMNAETLKLTELYQTKDNQITTIGWSFHTILNVTFDQNRYPFNLMKLSLQLFHPNFEKNIILIPDFESYQQHEVDKNIGISKNIILEKGLSITNSYFFYRMQENQSDFGIASSVRKQDFPELLFQIDMKQGIVNPLIAYLIPLIIISLILFYILLEISILTGSTRSNIERIDLLGQVGALFLALVFAHQTLRNFLKVNTVAYLECYYFVMYAFTFIVASACMSKRLTIATEWLHAFSLKIIASLRYIYWPLIFGLIFSITMYFFY